MPSDLSVGDLWKSVVQVLVTRSDINPSDLAFAKLAKPLGVIDGTLLVAVPSGLVKDRLEMRMRGALL